MAISVPSKINLTTSQSVPLLRRRYSNLVRCAPFPQFGEQDAGVSILCEPCNGKGWVPCGFCEGKKTNVKSESKRIYRRCPTCKAIGYVLCSKCKVFKCVTFPSYSDGEL